MLKAQRTLLTAALAFTLACDGTTQTTKPTVPKDLDASGTYALASTVDVPPTVLATSTVNVFLSLLRLLRNDPAACPSPFRGPICKA